VQDGPVEVSQCGKLRKGYAQEQKFEKMALHDYERKTRIVEMQKRAKPLSPQ
jgi:hypothetical protein